MANADATPLMPHATAAWLVDNTGLTFVQIAEYCGIHILEVQAIADETKMSKQAQDTIRRTRGPRYTPVSKRQDKPDGIAWILKNHPEVSDGAIGKLIGTTRNTIGAIRDRSHWNSANIVPKDPVTLGLCSQRELDALVAKAAKKAGIKAPEDSRFEGDREALLEELRAERTAANEARAAEEASETANDAAAD